MSAPESNPVDYLKEEETLRAKIYKLLDKALQIQKNYKNVDEVKTVVKDNDSDVDFLKHCSVEDIANIIEEKLSKALEKNEELTNEKIILEQCRDALTDEVETNQELIDCMNGMIDTLE